jgi:tRNA modification GTPase
MAQPGEFTLRAFLNGRLDLTQAEAVLGVIDAEDAFGLETALNQLSGNLGSPLRSLRRTLLETLAHLEAGFDFADEDISFISQEDLLGTITDARRFIEEKLTQINERTDHRYRRRVILTGPPNSGKSSLFNALSVEPSEEEGTPAAIISEIAGTTRDYLEKEIVLNEKRVLLIDTAGLGSEGQVISDQAEFGDKHRTFEERICRLTEKVLTNADLTLYCQVASLFLCKETSLPAPQTGTFILLTKCDLLSERERRKLPVRENLFPVSSLTGEGLDELRTALVDVLLRQEGRGEIVRGTALRCRRSFAASRDALFRAADMIREGADEALIAFELRSALDEIGKILGAVQTDDILDSIFSRFCIGK